MNPQPIGCGRCSNGLVPIVSITMDFAPRGEMTFAAQTFYLPAGANRTLEWFNRIMAYPVKWTCRLSSVFCDCRESALNTQERKDNADPNRSDQRQRSRVHREVIGYCPPAKEEQHPHNVISDVSVMLSETFPVSESAMTQADIGKALDIRRRFEGDLLYEVPAWVLRLGGVSGRVPGQERTENAPKGQGDVQEQDRKRAASGDAE